SEAHRLRPSRGPVHVARRDVAQARVEPPEQLVARRRYEEHRERPLAQLLGVLLVEVALEIAHVLGGDPALAPFVIEEQRPAVGNQHAEDAPLQHLREVALPRRVLEAELARWGCRRLFLRERDPRGEHHAEHQRPEPGAARPTEPGRRGWEATRVHTGSPERGSMGLLRPRSPLARPSALRGPGTASQGDNASVPALTATRTLGLHVG